MVCAVLLKFELLTLVDSNLQILEPQLASYAHFMLGQRYRYFITHNKQVVAISSLTLNILIIDVAHVLHTRVQSTL